MTKELVALVIAAIGLFFVHRQGVKHGEREAQLDNLEEKEDLLNEITAKELEATQSKPILDRISGIRDRILRRRGDGSS